MAVETLARLVAVVKQTIWPVTGRLVRSMLVEGAKAIGALGQALGWTAVNLARLLWLALVPCYQTGKHLCGLAFRALHKAARILDFLTFAAKRFYRDDCFQTASALAYTALLATVPLVTIISSLLSNFPEMRELGDDFVAYAVGNLFPQPSELDPGIVPSETAASGSASSEKMDQSLLADGQPASAQPAKTPIPQGSAENSSLQVVHSHLNTFIENAAGRTAFGVVGLVISAILLLSTIEGAFGSIWRVTEPRSWMTRLLSFWGLLTLAPLLFGTSLSAFASLFALYGDEYIASTVGSLEELGPLLPGLGELIGFTLIYVWLPNRLIHWRDAFRGALVAVLALELSKAAFLWYLQTFPSYTTIYGALAIVPIFLLWLYIAWSTILIGAVVTAALPEWRDEKILNEGGTNDLPQAARLMIAATLLGTLLEAARIGKGVKRAEILAQVPVGETLIENTLDQLERAHWVAPLSRGRWVLTRDLSEPTFYDLKQSLYPDLDVRIDALPCIQTAVGKRCSQVLRKLQRSQKDAMTTVKLRELLAAAPQPVEQPVPRLQATVYPGRPAALGDQAEKMA